MQRRIIAVAVPSIGPLLPCEQNRLFMDDSSRHRSSGAQRRTAPHAPSGASFDRASLNLSRRQPARRIFTARAQLRVCAHAYGSPRNLEHARLPHPRGRALARRVVQRCLRTLPKRSGLARSRHNLSDSAHAGMHRGVQQPGDHADAPFVLPALAEVHATQAAPREQSAHANRRNTSAAEDATVTKRHAAAPVRIHRPAHPTSSQQHGSKETNMDWRLSASRCTKPVYSIAHACDAKSGCGSCVFTTAAAAAAAACCSGHRRLPQ